MHLKGLAFVLGVGFGGLLQAQTVSIVTGEWPPFTDSNSHDLGIGLTIVTEAFKAVGIEVRYDFVPWKRAYSQAKHGLYDATGIWVKNPKREVDFYYSDEVILHRAVFFYLKTQAINWQTLEDLQGKVIGATSGYAYRGGFEALEKSKILSVVRAHSDQINLNKLIQKRIDLFAVDLDVGYYLLRKHFTPKEMRLVTHHERTLSSSPTHLLVSKKHPQATALTIIDQFNEGLESIKTSGVYSDILNRSRQQSVFEAIQ